MKFEIEDNKTRKTKENNKQQKLLVFASIFFAVLSIILILVYFNTQNKTTTNTQEPKEETKKETKKEEKEEKEEKTNSRPFAVMIDNESGDYTHAGLQDSYVNYEMTTSNGQSKILALFKDEEVGVIGPVTSADHYFLDYALEHKAVLTSYGMSEYTKKLINADNYNYIDGKEDSNAFMQDKETNSHNIFTSTDRMLKVLEKKNYKTTAISNEVFKYSEEEINLQDVEGSKKSSYINLKYSTDETREYKYDSNNKYYLRSNNGKPDVDRKTNEQLHYKNIIIIYIVTDTVPKENITNVNTIGEGEGYFVTNGYAAPIKWEKANQKSKTIYKYKDGKELKLNSGNTFVQIVPGTED